jgi:hypothetical protein
VVVSKVELLQGYQHVTSRVAAEHAGFGTAEIKRCSFDLMRKIPE